MASEPLKNVGVSVRDRLLNRSREERIDFQLLLTRSALERLLYRLSRSEHRNRFILKGAMLFATWVDTPFRPTRDLDLLSYGEGSPEAIGQCFRAICNQPVDNDGVVFDVDGLEAGLIREDSEYGGVRIRTQATIAGARIPIQVDVGFGDAITPGPIEIDYPVLLDAPAPQLRAYPVETVVAETFELERAPLVLAVRQTFARRETALPQDNPTGLSEAYVEAWADQWRTFLSRERMTAAPEQLANVIADLQRYLLPLIDDVKGDWRWNPTQGWTQGTAT